MPRETKIDPAKLDPVRRRIWHLLQRKLVDMKTASGFAGRADTYMRDYFVKGIPDELPEPAREGLARNLHVPADFFRKKWEGSPTVDLLKNEHTSKTVAGTNQKDLASHGRGQRTDLYEPLTEPVYLIGQVQAGAWVESNRLPEEQWTKMDLPADTLFPGVQRYALRNVGESMNRECANGGIWVFVELRDLIGIGPKPGDYVIVERKRTDGMIEATCKRLELRGGKPWLCPDSTDPSFEPFPIVGDAEIEEIVVRGLVVQVINKPGTRR